MNDKQSPEVSPPLESTGHDSWDAKKDGFPIEFLVAKDESGTVTINIDKHPEQSGVIPVETVEVRDVQTARRVHALIGEEMWKGGFDNKEFAAWVKKIVERVETA